MNKYDNREFILELFNLEDDSVDRVEFTNVNGSALLDIFLMPKYDKCPRCGFEKPDIKGYVRKNITHSALSDRKCILAYHARRYICPICSRTYYEFNPFCFKSQKISALTVGNVLRDLKLQNETFSSVAARYYISPTSAASIFDSHVVQPRYSLPQYMSWDECYAFHSYTEKSKYVCMFLDYSTADPVDLIPSRKKEYLFDYFYQIPRQERDNVRMISTDMFETYRTVIRTMFPNALQSVDHYHLSQDLSRSIDAVRMREMKKWDRKSDEYYLLKKFNWLIYKRPDSADKDHMSLFDPNRKRKKNVRLNTYLNYYDIRERLMDISKTGSYELREAWLMKEAFISFYDNNTAETAEEALNTLISSYEKSAVYEIRQFAKTLKKWKTEIINSFIVVFTEYRTSKDTGHVVLSERKLNNGLMENRNSILKIIKKNANGYTNWERFRNRCLYVLRKDAVPLLNPIDRRKEK